MQTADLPSFLVAIIAAVIALASVVYARRADASAAAALRLAERAFAGERRGQIRTVRSDGKLIIEPLAPDAAINKLVIFFPTVLELPPLEVVAPNLYFFETRIAHRVVHFWEQRTAGLAAHATVRRGSAGTIPVAIVVHAYARGEASVSSALYDLRTTYIKTDNGSGSFTSSLTVDGLSFNNLLANDVDPLPILDSELLRYEPTRRDA